MEYTKAKPFPFHSQYGCSISGVFLYKVWHLFPFLELIILCRSRARVGRRALFSRPIRACEVGMVMKIH